PEDIQDNEKHDPFQRELIELGGMARLGPSLRKYDGPGHIGHPAPQLTVKEVADTAHTQTKRNERRHKVGHSKEVTIGLVGKPDHGGDDTDQATVERHATGPDLEQVEGVGQEHIEVVKQYITNP